MTQQTSLKLGFDAMGTRKVSDTNIVFCFRISELREIDEVIKQFMTDYKNVCRELINTSIEFKYVDRIVPNDDVLGSLIFLFDRSIYCDALFKLILTNSIHFHVDVNHCRFLYGGANTLRFYLSKILHFISSNGNVEYSKILGLPMLVYSYAIDKREDYYRDVYSANAPRFGYNGSNKSYNDDNKHFLIVGYYYYYLRYRNFTEDANRFADEIFYINSINPSLAVDRIFDIDDDIFS